MASNSLRSYLKYISNNYDVLKSIFAEKKIRFTQPAALNDPLDCNPILSVPCAFGEHTDYVVNGIIMPSANLWYRVQLIESNINAFGILSLTKNPKSFDMWSRYANGHKGCLIELSLGFNTNPAFQSENQEAYPVVPVSYVDYPRIDLLECASGDGTITSDLLKGKIFYTKGVRWATESEYRLVRPLSDLGMPHGGLRTGTYRDFDTIYRGDLPFDVIESVTFGAFMPRETKLWIADQCRGTSIQFLQCFIFPNEKDEAGLAPRVELLSLEDLNLRDKVLQLSPELILLANKDLLQQDQIQLKSIEDLPYYQGFEDLVRLMYSKRAEHF
jgi:hypothetical protein